VRRSFLLNRFRNLSREATDREPGFVRFDLCAGWIYSYGCSRYNHGIVEQLHEVERPWIGRALNLSRMPGNMGMRSNGP